MEGTGTEADTWEDVGGDGILGVNCYVPNGR